MWIGEDTLFGDVILAFTSRSTSDDFHHINFYKIIRLNDGKLEVFEYKLDAIRTKLIDREPGKTIQDSASFAFGSFMWTSINDDGNLMA